MKPIVLIKRISAGHLHSTVITVGTIYYEINTFAVNDGDPFTASVVISNKGELISLFPNFTERIVITNDDNVA